MLSSTLAQRPPLHLKTPPCSIIAPSAPHVAPELSAIPELVRLRGELRQKKKSVGELQPTPCLPCKKICSGGYAGCWWLRLLALFRLLTLGALLCCTLLCLRLSCELYRLAHCSTSHPTAVHRSMAELPARASHVQGTIAKSNQTLLAAEVRKVCQPNHASSAQHIDRIIGYT